MSTESSNGRQPFPVVGIGASAGGLEAITSLLAHLEPDLGMTYVIIQHLSPDHESLLTELLQRRTKMPVHQVTNGVLMEPNNIYVIPPASYVNVVDGHLSLTTVTKKDKDYRIIDHFLQTLAPVYQNNAIAIILSGVGSDGTVGVQAIKSEGGITFAQDDSALFHSMAKNAYESGFVDLILSPEQIAAELSALSRQNYAHRLLDDTVEVDENDIRKIEAMLFNYCGVDFGNYKRTTIHRRILRRMALKRLTNLSDYSEFLKENPSETELLYRDLLINVTYFFREPELFKELSDSIFPELIKNRKSDSPIRIWIPACSSGEEAFSMAIGLFEFLGERLISTPIQIFATDLSEPAIEKARLGIFSKNSLQNVSSERLARFFIKIDGSYQIIKPIRDVCIFASHNLLNDPPFSRIDLISCQNVMIYFSPAAQKKIIQAFHYALRPAGTLVLGKSESVGSDGELFEQIDKNQKIFRKKAAAPGMNLNFFSRYHPPVSYSLNQKFAGLHNSEKDIERETDKILLSRYVPASVVINDDMQILRFHGPIYNYLQPAAGKASLHLLKMLRNELLFELRGMMAKVKKEGHPVKKSSIQLSENGDNRQISIEISPVKSYTSEAYFLIVFMDDPLSITQTAPLSTDTSTEDFRDKKIQSLQLELREAREHMKSMNEEFEATREELQSANEEVLSSNEELQSINEELETSKEELQSTNEELITINEELQLRNADLKESVEYVQAIVETIREPLVVLHTDLRIRTANKAFYSIFNLKNDIEGRFLYNIDNGVFDIEELRNQLLKTISRGTEFQDFELTVPGQPGEKTLMFNAMRMVHDAGKTTRILVAIQEVTERRKAEEALRRSEERFRLVIESANEYAIFTLQASGIVDSWSPGAARIFGYSSNEIIGKSSTILFTAEDQANNVPFQEIHAALTTGSALDERWHKRKDGTLFFASGVMSRISSKKEQGLVKIARDMTERKLIEQHKDEFIGVASHELKTPVTTIKAYTELLEETLKMKDEKNATILIRKLNNQVERLTNLVKDLLDVTKINEGQLHTSLEEFDINPLISKCVEEIALISKKHRIICELDDNVTVVSDRSRVEQVLINLLSNAIKFSPHEGNIFVRSARQADKLLISVSDSGIGMTEETRQKAFDRFYRASGESKEVHAGLGLGLFIASAIINSLGGDIWAESEPDKGTTIFFTIPA